MGIIDAIRGAYDGAFADSWLEAITIDEYRPGQLVAIGHAMHSSRGTNTQGTPDVITDGSKVFLAYSETAIAVENGEILHVYSEPGMHVFHSERSKGFFSGKSIKEGLKNINEDAKERVTFGGDKALVQKIYYINQRENPGNNFALEGVPVRISSGDGVFDVDCSCNIRGTYSFKIVDALAFYKNFVGNAAKSFFSDPIVGLINAFIANCLQTAISKLFSEGIRPAAMVEYAEALAKKICEETSEKLGPERGLAIISCGIETFTLNGQDLHMLQEIQRDEVLTDPTMAAAHLVGATADAMQTIAYNAADFRGPGGYDLIGLALMEKRKAEGIETPKRKTGRVWRCVCGRLMDGKFCTLCGHQRVNECKECGGIGTGKFCPMCGTPFKLDKI